MIPYPWEFPEKNMEKNFLMGISMRFTILWEIPLSTFSHGKSPQYFLHGKPPLFTKPLWEILTIFSPWETPTFFLSTPLWEIPYFFTPPYGKSPKKWGCPLGRGGMGGYLPPPMGYMGGVIIKIAC